MWGGKKGRVFIIWKNGIHILPDRTSARVQTVAYGERKLLLPPRLLPVYGRGGQRRHLGIGGTRLQHPPQDFRVRLIIIKRDGKH